MATDLQEMAQCFVEEFLRMGYSEQALLVVFSDPFYRGPHAAYREFGEQWVRGLIRRTAGHGEEGACV